MRQIVKCFFLIVSISVTKVCAQNYTVGTQVNDTLTTSSYHAFYNCYPNADFQLVFPFSTVTGVDHILIFTSVTPANSIYTVPGDTINIGDTLIFSQSQSAYTFYFPSNGSIGYIFKAIGTPQIANETYYCGNCIWIDGASTCYNFRNFMCDSTCTVYSTALLNDNFDYESEFLFFPNPANNNLTLMNIKNHTLTDIKLLNLLGNIEFSSIEKGEEIKINLSNLPSGLYLIEVYFDNNTIRKKIIKE